MRVDSQRDDARVALEAFRTRPLASGARITLGAVVEVEDGAAGRTFFLAPVGAGIELTADRMATASSRW